MNGAKKNTRAVGSLKETEACTYLENKGYEILERNFQTKAAEIDIVAKTKDLAGTSILVFVEVKYRGNMAKGSALEAVDARKQRQICKVADYYRYLHKMGENTMVRYDVLAIQGENIQWIRNAFPHIYTRG